jgi:mono/diheme cytochrome c family protein
MLLTGKVPVYPAAMFDHSRAGIPTPAQDTTVDYGLYLVRVGGCNSCHGENLSGRPPFNGDPNGKMSANLTPGGIGEWTLADFTRALRDGIGAGGRIIDSTAMPVRYTREMNDQEIQAVWAYLRSVPAKQFGEM